jgi:hypothetical protein
MMTPKEVWDTAGAVVLSVGGGGAIVLALSSWLGKVWASRILEQDRAKYAREIEELRSSLERTNRAFQGEIEKTLFVTKTHFETEFKILREIWQRVSEVRATMSVLRPMSGYPATRPEQEAHLNRVFEAFMADLINLVHAVDHNSPFYPQEIYVLLDQLIHVAQRERDEIELTLHERFGLEWFSRGKENFGQYMTLVEKVGASIRERLSKLAVRGVDYD